MQAWTTLGFSFAFTREQRERGAALRSAHVQPSARVSDLERSQDLELHDPRL
jgi:hypothetical protein